MNRVFGNINLIISTGVESCNETMGLLQANYKVNKERFIGYELYGINCKGERESIIVHDCDNVELNEFID